MRGMELSEGLKMLGKEWSIRKCGYDSFEMLQKKFTEEMRKKDVKSNS